MYTHTNTRTHTLSICELLRVEPRDSTEPKKYDLLYERVFFLVSFQSEMDFDRYLMYKQSICVN